VKIINKNKKYKKVKRKKNMQKHTNPGSKNK